MERCSWCGTDPIYVAYHDQEWGVPIHDGRALWEMLILEGQQAGLAWITILRKREKMRAAFAGFRPEVLAEWREAEIAAALTNPGIIRHRGKVAAVVRNARAYLALGGAEAFSALVWDTVGGAPLQPRLGSVPEARASSEESHLLSKRLKKADFGFCGPTTVYAFMQAAGLVNDHAVSCFRHAELS